eukprot:183917-Hanusia_phi.AAC.1
MHSVNGHDDRWQRFFPLSHFTTDTCHSFLTHHVEVHPSSVSPTSLPPSHSFPHPNPGSFLPLGHIPTHSPLDFISDSNRLSRAVLRSLATPNLFLDCLFWLDFLSLAVDIA